MRGRRVAIFGASRRGDPTDGRVFRSRGDGGNGELQRLLMAIRAGTLEEVVIDHRFNGHAGVRAVVAACRRRGVRYTYR